eukprot:SAG31_NODE_655_length_13127_cov_20.616058_2_plen_46_part_00
MPVHVGEKWAANLWYHERSMVPKGTKELQVDAMAAAELKFNEKCS